MEEGDEEEQCELAAECEAELEGVGLAEAVTDAQPLGVTLELEDRLMEGELEAQSVGWEDAVGVRDARPVLLCEAEAEGESVLRVVGDTEAQAEAVNESEELGDGLVDPAPERVALLEREAEEDGEAEGQVVPDREGTLLGECVPDTEEKAVGVAVSKPEFDPDTLAELEPEPEIELSTVCDAMVDGLEVTEVVLWEL